MMKNHLQKNLKTIRGLIQLTTRIALKQLTLMINK